MFNTRSIVKQNSFITQNNSSLEST